jgi:lipid-A-disaccharide synthase
LQPDARAARTALGLDAEGPVLAVLPGSRRGEVSRLARPFLETAMLLQRELAGLQVVVPLVSEGTRRLFEEERSRTAPDLALVKATGSSRLALAAADVVLTASGTATLEGLLSKRPMVVGYKLNSATYLAARLFRLVRVEHVAMANLLAGERLAPELLQRECEADHLLPPLRRFFEHAEIRHEIAARYRDIHLALRMDTNREAANAVVGLLQERGLV